MKHKYSLAYLTVLGIDPVSQIRIAKKTGYDFVSLRTIPMHLPGEPEFLLHKDSALFADVRAALEDSAVKLSDIELARIRQDLDIAEYEPAFEAAAELGASDVLGSIWTRDRIFYTQQAAQLCRTAAEYGLRYNIEFLPWAGVRNLQEAVTLIDDLRKLGVGNARIMVDTLHAGRAGVTAEELKRTDAGYYGFMHICDGPVGPARDPVLDDIRDPLMLKTAREERLYPGEGVMDIRGMAEATGAEVLSIELPNLARMAEFGAEKHAEICLEYAKKLLEN